MNKPLYLLPFIYVYKLVDFLASLPIKLVKYFSLGFFLTIYVTTSFIIDLIFNLIKYIAYGIYYLLLIIYRGSKLFIKASSQVGLNIVIYPSVFLYRLIRYFFIGLKTTIFTLLIIITKLVDYIIKGFICLSFFVYKFFKYVVYGAIFPLVPIANAIGALSLRYKAYQSLKQAREARRFAEKQQEYERRHAERLKREEELKTRRVEIIAERKRLREKDEYRNEKIVVEKKKLADHINDFLVMVVNIPKKTIETIKKKYNNSSLVKNMRNKRDIERESLLISFDGEDAERSNQKILYEYVGKNADGKIVKGYFDAYSKVEVHSFLLSEGFEVYSISSSQLIRFLHGGSGSSKVKVKTKDLIFFLTQLSTYIKAGIPLVESLKILTRQFKNKGYQRIFRSLIYDLTMGESFSDALTKQGVSFPRLLTNMVKAAEMTGQLPEVLDDMSEYYTEMDKTRKQMVTAMMYPLIILVVAIVVITFILMFVIPRFVQIYDSMESSQIPAFTKMIIGLSAFLQNNLIYIIIALIILIFIFKYLYDNVKLFKTLIQWIIMHIPGFGNVIIYNEVTMFTKTFSSLLSHNVFITDSMDILNKITDNEIYKMLILDTITNLAKGEKISEAFKDHWAFPVPAYEMIVTGEKTGELPEMMSKVSSYYQELHANSVLRMKTFMEPVLIIFLTVVVGGIVLSIIIPMFNMYSAIQTS